MRGKVPEPGVNIVSDSFHAIGFLIDTAEINTS